LVKSRLKLKSGGGKNKNKKNLDVVPNLETIKSTEGKKDESSMEDNISKVIGEDQIKTNIKE
jgi:hypothetical protein